MRSLAVAIVRVLIAAHMQSWAQPISPKPPALGLFSDCTNSDDPAPPRIGEDMLSPSKTIY